MRHVAFLTAMSTLVGCTSTHAPRSAVSPPQKQAMVPGPADLSPTSRAQGPELSYAARVRRAIQVNIIHTEPIEGSPEAEVEVRTAPDGSITGVRLISSSGLASWDNAVLRALARTERIPLDIHGRVPPVLVVVFQALPKP